MYPKFNPAFVDNALADRFFSRILNNLCRKVDLFTGEVIEGLNDEVIFYLKKMIRFFDWYQKWLETNPQNYEKYGKTWTKKNVEDLTNYYNQGKSVVEMSKKLNRTPNSVRFKLQELGLEDCEWF